MQTLIIGGGLSGLALANALEANGHEYVLDEARGRFGGRIKTEHHGAGYLDMGPAWFWPGQMRILALIDRLGLEKFDQFSKGVLTLEDEQGRVQHGPGVASTEGSWRLRGGLGVLTRTLADQLPETHKRLNAAVTALAKTDKCRATESDFFNTIRTILPFAATCSKVRYRQFRYRYAQHYKIAH